MMQDVNRLDVMFVQGYPSLDKLIIFVCVMVNIWFMCKNLLPGGRLWILFQSSYFIKILLISNMSSGRGSHWSAIWKRISKLNLFSKRYLSGNTFQHSIFGKIWLLFGIIHVVRHVHVNSTVRWWTNSLSYPHDCDPNLISQPILS